MSEKKYFRIGEGYCIKMKDVDVYFSPCDDKCVTKEKLDELELDTRDNCVKICKKNREVFELMRMTFLEETEEENPKQHVNDISEAIKRNSEAEQPIPLDWITELLDLGAEEEFKALVNQLTKKK